MNTIIKLLLPLLSLSIVACAPQVSDTVNSAPIYYVTQSKDSFTGSVTKYLQLSKNLSLRHIIAKSGNQYLVIDVKIDNGKEYPTITESKSLSWKIDNAIYALEVVDGSVKYSNEPFEFASRTYNAFTTRVTYSVTKDVIAAINKNSTIFFRIYTSGGFYDLELSPSSIEFLKKFITEENL